MRTRKHTPRPWRMKATFPNGETKTIAYASKAAAIASGEFELSVNATEYEVWHAGSEGWDR